MYSYPGGKKCSLRLHDSSESSERPLDARYILKVKTTDCTDKLKVEWKKKEGIQNKTNIVGLRTGRVMLPSPELGNANGGAVLGE